ncbi:hypothetical protein D3C75_270560 [compost metagenome]
MKTLLVTGYRAHEIGIFSSKHPGIPYIKKALAARITPLLDEGLEWIITPGQYGVDLWACETALELKALYPELRLGIIAAHAEPESRWKEEKQEEFRRIVARADYYGSISKRPFEGSWQFRARDELLMRKSDGILLVYDEEAAQGSPKYIKQEALKLHEETGYALLTVTMEDIQSMADEEQQMADYDTQQPE